MIRLFLFVLLASAVHSAVPAWREQVGGLISQRQWAEAESLLNQLTTAEPTNAEAWYYRGEVHLARGENEQALAASEKATSLDKTQSRYFVQLGHAAGLNALKAGLFAKLGFARRCQAAYEQAVALDPSNIDARWSLMEFCRQAPAFIGGGLTAAYAQANEISRIDPRRGRAALALLYVGEKKFAEAFALYEDVLRDKPGEADALYNLGRLAVNTGQHLDRGLAALREFLAREPQANHVRTHTFIGLILQKQGDATGARAEFAAAVAADPTYTPALEALRKMDAAPLVN